MAWFSDFNTFSGSRFSYVRCIPRNTGYSQCTWRNIFYIEDVFGGISILFVKKKLLIEHTELSSMRFRFQSKSIAYKNNISLNNFINKLILPIGLFGSDSNCHVFWWPSDCAFKFFCINDLYQQINFTIRVVYIKKQCLQIFVVIRLCAQKLLFKQLALTNWYCQLGYLSTITMSQHFCDHPIVRSKVII